MKNKSFTREVLHKGKAQYNCPPCTNYFRSAPFNNNNITCMFYKTSYLDEVVNCTERFPSVSIPWFYSSDTWRAAAVNSAFSSSPIFSLFGLNFLDRSAESLKLKFCKKEFCWTCASSLTLSLSLSRSSSCFLPKRLICSKCCKTFFVVVADKEAK